MIGPFCRSASLTTSAMSSTCASNAPGGDRNWNRSCPCWAATSALARVPRSASAMWSTVTSIPFAVPHSLAYLSNQASYEGTKWLHWRILRVFWGRLIRMVGPPPRAAATAAPAVVATNSRRSIRFCCFMNLPSIPGKRRVAERAGSPSATTRHSRFGSPARSAGSRGASQRIQHAEGDLVGARRAGVVPRHRPEVLQADRVAARPEAQQGVVVVTLLAGQSARRRIVLGEPLYVGLVHPGVRPQAPVRGEVITGLGPRAPAADVPVPLRMLRDVSELLAERLAIVEVAVDSKLARLDVGARLDSPGRHIGVLRTGVGRITAGAGGVLPVDVTHYVSAPA